MSRFTALFGGGGTVATITLLVAVAAGVTAEFVVTESLPVFTDQQVSAANPFTTGSVSIDEGPDSAFLSVSNMMPGDSIIRPLTITNAGVGARRYSMTTSADNVDGEGLRDQLQLTVRVKTANPCSSEDGAIISGASILSGGGFGSSAQGADTGDRVLVASASEVLCFKVDLSLNTDNSYVGASTTATFTFDAEQTIDNP